MPNENHYALLACDVFSEEIEAFGGESPPWAELVYLEMGLHDRPDDLRTVVQLKIGELESTNREKGRKLSHVVLAYGMCGNGLIGVQSESATLVIPRAHDCISVFIGCTEKHQEMVRTAPDQYFYSPGWIRGKRVPGPDREKELRKVYSERYDDDEEMVEELIEADREAFGHYKHAAYIDLTNNVEAEKTCQDCARFMGWGFRRLESDPTWLRTLIFGQWDDPRILQVEPGCRIALSDGQVVSQAVS